MKKFLREESFADEAISAKILGFAGIYFRGRKENYAEIYFRGYC